MQEELELEERKHYVNSGKLKNTTRKKKIYIEDSEESWSSDKKVKYVKEKKIKKKIGRKESSSKSSLREEDNEMEQYKQPVKKKKLVIK